MKMRKVRKDHMGGEIWGWEKGERSSGERKMKRKGRKEHRRGKYEDEIRKKGQRWGKDKDEKREKGAEGRERWWGWEKGERTESRIARRCKKGRKDRKETLKDRGTNLSYKRLVFAIE
jgi:hypothetical protein